MFCPNCGNEMSDSAAFCTNCGWSKSGGGAAGTKKFNVPVVPIVAIVSLIAIVLLIKNVFLGRNGFKSGRLVTSYTEDTTIDQIETVTFGLYPQSDANGNKKEPVEWVVLDRQDGKALLLSKYILDCKSYNNESEDVTWETCELRNWLNNDFYNQAFSSAEQGKIQLTNIVNIDNSQYETSGGNNTNDRIFCLSIDEIVKYFYQENMQGVNKRLATRGTKYAKSVYNGGDKLYIAEGSDAWYDGNSYYWLRSPGDSQRYAAYVDNLGYLNAYGNPVLHQLIGVRPALWVEY